MGVEGFDQFYWIQTLALRFCSGSKHLVHMKVSKRINESTPETNESRIKPIMNQRYALDRNNVCDT